MAASRAFWSLCLLWVLVCLSPQWVDAWEKIIDDGDPGYSETGVAWATWQNGEAYGGSYRYLSHQNKGLVRKGTATWQVALPYTGTYEISVHFRQTVNRTSDADYVIVDGSGKRHTFSLNQQALPTGWHKLGTFSWNKGQVSKVVLDGTDDTQSDEADAVRWRLTSNQPPPPVQNCNQQNPGTYTLKRFASQVSAAGDWTNAKNAQGADDGNKASSPNVDAGDVLTAANWKFCTPPGNFRITRVQVGIKAHMQYESGVYQLVMYLEAAGKRVTFSQTSLRWVTLDITGTKANWSIQDLNALTLRTGLSRHPGGKRDSDAWVDAFSVEISYQIQASCPSGQSLCNGACVALSQDGNHCGACGNKCPTGQSCKAGSCVPLCRSGQSLCGSACVNLQNDPSHCGQCGVSCPATQACAAGACKPTSTCDAPRITCGGTCLDPRANNDHCGACNNTCPSGASCQSGKCVAGSSCPASQILCGKLCVDPSSSVSHCGQCGFACGQNEACVQGKCQVGPTCRAPNLMCNGTCINPLIEERHCGACNNQCPAGQSCVDGNCQVLASCPQNQQACADACVDIRESNDHCGACGNKCQGGATCIAGQCLSSENCSSGALLCKGACLDVQNDPSNCGSCGSWCEPGESCILGTCRPTPEQKGGADGGRTESTGFSPRGCGCQTSGSLPSSLIPLLLLALVVLRRRVR